MVTRCCGSRKYFKMNGSPVCMNRECSNYLCPTRMGYGLGVLRNFLSQITPVSQPRMH